MQPLDITISLSGPGFQRLGLGASPLRAPLNLFQVNPIQHFMPVFLYYYY
jgi:hypothetical protein